MRYFSLPVFFRRLRSHRNQAFSRNDLLCPVLSGSGIAEPAGVAAAAADAENTGGGDIGLRLDTLVTVVDAQAFLSEYMSSDRVGARPSLAAAEGASKIDTRSVVQLLVDQAPPHPTSRSRKLTHGTGHGWETAGIL